MCNLLLCNTSRVLPAWYQTRLRLGFSCPNPTTTTFANSQSPAYLLPLRRPREVRLPSQGGSPSHPPAGLSLVGPVPCSPPSTATLTVTYACTAAGLLGGAPRRPNDGGSKKVPRLLLLFCSIVPSTVDARTLTPPEEQTTVMCLLTTHHLDFGYLGIYRL